MQHCRDCGCARHECECCADTDPAPPQPRPPAVLGPPAPPDPAAEILALAAEALREIGATYLLVALTSDDLPVASVSSGGPRLACVGYLAAGISDEKNSGQVTHSDLESLSETWYDTGCQLGAKIP
jgi:hypothetical protein